jgi:hypothetical protein
LDSVPSPLPAEQGRSRGARPTFFFGVPAGQVGQPDGISRSVDASRKLFGSHDRFAARANTFTVRSDTLPMEDATQTLGGVWIRDGRRLDKQGVLVPSRHAPPPSPPPVLLATPNGCGPARIEPFLRFLRFLRWRRMPTFRQHRRSHKVAFASDQPTRQFRPRWGI